MGYLSDVTIVCSKTVYREIMSAVDHYCDEAYKMENGDFYVHFSWRKWYPVFKEVQQVEEILSDFEDRYSNGDNDVKGEFADMFIFGEDINDYEALYYGDESKCYEYYMEMCVGGLAPKDNTYES